MDNKDLKKLIDSADDKTLEYIRSLLEKKTDKKNEKKPDRKKPVKKRSIFEPDLNNLGDTDEDIEEKVKPIKKKKSVKAKKEVALKNKVERFTVQSNADNRFSLNAFLIQAQPIIIKNLTERLNGLKGLKVNLILKVILSRRTNTNETIDETVYFSTKAIIITNPHQLKDILAKREDWFNQKIAEFCRSGSGWVFKYVQGIDVNSVIYKPLKGASYIELPTDIKNRRACINVINNDNKCFMWAILSALHPQDKHSERVSKYRPYENELKFDGIEFPVSKESYKTFEKLNNMSINVFDTEFDAKDKTNVIKPLYLTSVEKEKHVNLLLITSDKNNHYVWIKNFSALMNYTNSDSHKKFYCFHCLHGFTEESLLVNHKALGCADHDSVKTVLPTKDTTECELKFKNHSKKLPIPFVIYADFECLTTKIANCDKNPEESFTEKYQKHEPCGYAYKIVSCIKGYDYNSELKLYRGVDATEKFVKALLNESEAIMKVINNPKEMIITAEQETEFKNAENCHICNEKLGDDRVRDHCHISGLYRGASHNGCNINFNYKNAKIPVVIHNFKGYDSHLVIQGIKNNIKKIDCIPLNTEKYLSVTLNKLVFIDSFSFLSSSLETLVNNIIKEGRNKFKYTSNYFNDLSEECKSLIFQKGVFPYDWCDSFDKFNATELPNIEEFFSILNNQACSQEDYNHAVNVWNKFQMKNFGEYHDLYLKTDVLLLADVFENFRNVCFNFYKLDPCHYFSLPGLAWDAMLLKTGVELDLIDNENVDQYLLFEKGIRGGISMISNRYGIANNKYLDDYDEEKEKSYIMYLDANNLYGWSMSQALPVGGFNWRDPEKWNAKKIMKLTDDNKFGYVFVVDLDYPVELHDKHNDYPVAPEKLAVQSNWLSDYSIQLRKDLEMSDSIADVEKLIPNLNDKKNYIVHYRNLKLYLSLGLKLTKIHKVIRFDQKPFLKEYIDFNTNQRAKSKNDFEKDFFKLMNNAVFGKTMENVRKRIDFELVNNDMTLDKLTAKPRYQSCKIFNEDLVGVEMQKSKIMLNKPVSVGFCILELSKLLMYDFHYNTMKAKYGDNLTLLFTDTDSLCYHIKTDDIYEDMKDMKDLLDTSEYPKDHPLYDVKNKKVIGKFKDETNGDAIKEFVGLKSKMYSFTVGDSEKKRAKGVKKNVIKQEIKHENYKDCLFNDTNTKLYQMNSIRSYNHVLYSIKINKLSLSSYDDKRYYINNLKSLSYGYYSIPK